MRKSALNLSSNVYKIYGKFRNMPVAYKKKKTDGEEEGGGINRSLACLYLV